MSGIITAEELQDIEEKEKQAMPKIGMRRNHPCFCESGKNYKNCHGKKIAAKAPSSQPPHIDR